MATHNIFNIHLTKQAKCITQFKGGQNFPIDVLPIAIAQGLVKNAANQRGGPRNLNSAVSGFPA